MTSRVNRTEEGFAPVIVPDEWNPEHALVASLLEGDAHAIAVASEEVSPKDFASERLALVYEAILALDAAGRRVDLVTVAEALKAQGKLETAGGAAFLAGLPSPAFPNVLEHARLVRDKGARRQLRQASLEVADLSRAEGVELPVLLEEAGRKLNEVLLKRQRSSFRPMGELVQDTLAMLDAMKREGGILGLGTGFPDVDRVLVGLQPGELAVLAARPGVGKTSFAMQVAEHHACGPRALPVAVFSLEMPARQLVLRMAAARARVPLEQLRRGRLSPAAEERVTEAMGALFEAPMHIDDSGDVSPLELRAKARRLKQQHPALALLVVDYLQLMRVRGRVESRQVEVAELSRSLKQLAKELELPILALAQINRRVEERKGPPMLSDLRESGAIEQDADVVVFLHRERVEEDEGDGGFAGGGARGDRERGFSGGGGRGDRGDRGERDAGVAGAAAAAAAELIPVEVHVAKQRNGPTGEAQLLFHGAYTRFESVRRGGV